MQHNIPNDETYIHKNVLKTSCIHILIDAQPTAEPKLINLINSEEKQTLPRTAVII